LASHAPLEVLLVFSWLQPPGVAEHCSGRTTMQWVLVLQDVMSARHFACRPWNAVPIWQCIGCVPGCPNHTAVQFLHDARTVVPCCCRLELWRGCVCSLWGPHDVQHCNRLPVRRVHEQAVRATQHLQQWPPWSWWRWWVSIAVQACRAALY